MFRLNDAVRRHQAQHQAQPAGRSVAMAVAVLSPRANPATMGVVATVAAVATPLLDPVDMARLVEQLRTEGARLQHHENALLFRPSHWQQVHQLGPHWKAVLHFLQQHESGEADGAGRSA
jgi:predicted mannosyl-3-phosphoglycerate phosphatase (HAD superfamily)